MKYLIDTHIFIYIIEGDKSKFSNNQLNILQNTNNEFYLSSISLWELAIKFRIGKIHLKYDFNDYLSVKRRTAKIKILPIKLNYIQKISTLITAIGHNDPFDHLIISQSLIENIPIITNDGKLPLYSNLKIIS